VWLVRFIPRKKGIGRPRYFWYKSVPFCIFGIENVKKIVACWLFDAYRTEPLPLNLLCFFPRNFFAIVFFRFWIQSPSIKVWVDPRNLYARRNKDENRLRGIQKLVCSLLSRKLSVTRDRCYDFFNIFAKKIGEKLAFLTRNKAKLCKNLIITLVFDKTPIFSPKIVENRRKLWS
jgi:hypothetical protein